MTVMVPFFFNKNIRMEEFLSPILEKRLIVWFGKPSLYSLIACMIVELKSNPILIHALMIYEQICLLFYVVYLITS